HRPAGESRSTVGRKAVSGSGVDRGGGEDHRQAMSEDVRLRFLVVDDEQSIRRLCMTVGEGLGFVCAEAETAEAVIESFETRPPDIVVSDLKLPSLSGADLLRKIKE